jgi:acyl-coenzyme A thioesterase PaaI-like protein
MRAPGSPLVTSSVHISYVRPVPLKHLVTFEVVMLHRGRTTATAQVSTRNAAGELCSVATVTGAAI